MSGAGVTRQEFLARVSAALGRRGGPAAPREAAAVDEAVARVVAPDANLVELFCLGAAGAGMVVHRVAAAGAAAELAEVAVRLGLRSIAAGSGAIVTDAAAGLRRAGVTVVDWRGRGLDGLYEMDAGLTGVEAAIAETGSLVCASGPEGRGLSLAPPVHLAIVRASQIVPDLVDYCGGLAGAALPSNLVLITGPSKTADIEGVLITGVHGPREVHVVVVEGA